MPPSSTPGTDAESLLLPGFDSPLDLGEEVPNLTLITQLGQPLELTDLAGTVVVLSFFSCQHPEGSPGAAAARRLIEFQDTLRPDLWERVQILTISTEPLIDTPDVLRRCGHDLGANPDRWTLTTPTSADFTTTAARLGVLLWNEDGEETAHTLSTLVIDQEGFLADHFRGLTQWSVGDLIAAVVQTAER
jgi:protein SCO1/2